MHCEYCASPNLVFLGTLGFRDHYRCRDCGMMNQSEGIMEEDSDGDYDDEYER